MAAFGLMEKFSNEPLLKQLTQYVMRDESRHVAFGVLSLETYYQELNEREMREREEFCYEGSRLMRDRLYAEEVWKEMNLPIEETREIVQNSEIMREFQKMLFSKIVPNVKRLGLLSPWLRERFHELDILKFEHDEPSA
jgi:ribonucleotide reductase beta subunit family protein with ferritin-like domain